MIIYDLANKKGTQFKFIPSIFSDSLFFYQSMLMWHSTPNAHAGEIFEFIQS